MSDLSAFWVLKKNYKPCINKLNHLVVKPNGRGQRSDLVKVIDVSKKASELINIDMKLDIIVPL